MLLPGRTDNSVHPSYIIKLIVDMMQPKPEDTICDPSFGSAGFRVAAGEYVREHYPEMFHKAELKAHFNNRMFNGFEFDGPTAILL